MTASLLEKIKKLLIEINKNNKSLNVVGMDQVQLLERLVFEVEDYWNVYRISRNLEPEIIQVS